MPVLLSAGKHFPRRDPSGIGSGSGLGITVGISLISLVVFLFFALMCVGYYRTSWTPGFATTRIVIPRRRSSRSRAPGLAKSVVENLPIVRFEESRTKDVELEERVEDGPNTNSDMQPVVDGDITAVTEIRSSKTNIASGTSTPTNKIPQEDSSCSICLEDFVESEEVRLLPCDHKFHPKCVDPWLKHVSGTCPVCRYNLNTQEVESDAVAA
ncbi:uncharacterized protein LY89DRAFT_752304 [Mollisia scopiformis]|uniref:RING-type E3 ubiquitin transferase n=1 Tax=Mollisia scopiformis TaxID=149040 RepID=A0A194X3D1_MOLSC|nr:uncharacterized protein LY89DRAFT_752304 [Mollisia scopiformis]KUJ14332.1 hypothetical protein LY89DRAFT_752304 [Mollisia scopiformis]